MNLYKYASPATFYPLAGKIIPWFAIPAAILFATGLFVGFFIAPPDFQQGEAYRIIFIHVPAAWMGMLLYVLMAIYAGIGWAFNARLSSMMASSLAVTGAMFTAISLITGAFWGKPTWGTWWEWDGRLTSMLVLFIIYLGYIALWNAVEDEEKAARLAAILCLVGLINLPIVHFSVVWWSTLHQPASVFRPGGSAIDPSMLGPLFTMAFAYMALFAALLLSNMRAAINRRRVEAARLRGASAA